MEFEHIIEPKGASKISMDSSGKLIVPDNPIVPFIEGDGIGSDITPAMISVVAVSYTHLTLPTILLV